MAATGYIRALFALALVTAAAPAIGNGAAVDEQALYGGEVRIGSQAPVPVHLEIIRSDQGTEVTITNSSSRFRLDGVQEGDVVTASLAVPGGGPVTLLFDGDRVSGQFELGGESGTLYATLTTKSAEEFFRPPTENLNLSEDELREDLEALVMLLTTRHASPFHRTRREVFERQVALVRRKMPHISGPQAVIEFRKLAALIGDGHTSVAAATDRPVFPLQLFWFEDGLRVVEVAPQHKHLLGAKLTQVEATPVADVIRELRPYAAQGESAWYYRNVAPGLIVEEDVLTNAGIGSDASRTFRFELVDGRSRQIKLRSSRDRRELAILGGAHPLWLRTTQQPLAVAHVADGAIYVNWRGYDGLPEQGAALAEQIEKQTPGRLIIDLRDNGGGDFNRGREFIRTLAEKTWLNRPDRLFVLTGRRTFSAAMANAVDFKKMSEATLVGEPPGGAPNNWQEVRSFHLPNSGLKVSVSTTYYEFLPGQQVVQPDVVIPPTAADWGSAYDAAVSYILNLAGSGSSEF